MYYVMSDIHGCYDKYEKMLRKIDLKDEDVLFVLGDVVDRGDDGVKILLDMMNRTNVIPIMGNHEYMAYTVLKKFNVEITEENYARHLDSDSMQAYDLWMHNGGHTTLKGFMELDRDNREAVMEYLEEFSLFEEVEAGGNTFVLVHGGLGDFAEDKDPGQCTIHDLIWSRCQYDKRYYRDKYLVTGHTPTALIDKTCEGRIYKNCGNIAIDCGAVFGLNLGCICLDTLEEFYAE